MDRWVVVLIGLIRAIRTIQLDDQDPDHNKVQVTRCETGVQLEILPSDSKDRNKGINFNFWFLFSWSRT